jgi:hypothetical protein
MLPWRRHADEARRERVVAQSALDSSREGAERDESLAMELEQIKRENNIAPRIAAAFRAGRPGPA